MSGNEEEEERLQEIIMTFITPNDNCSLAFTEQIQTLAKTFQDHKLTQNGELLGTMESKDIRSKTMFPMIHFANVWFQHNEFEFFESETLGTEFSFSQGIYKEYKSYELRSSDSTFTANVKKAFIFLGYKSLEITADEYLMESWLRWTGAQMIHSRLPNNVKALRYTFYHRVFPADTNLFMYVLLIECKNITAVNQMHLLHFIQKIRIERGSGYLTAYRSNLFTSASSLLQGILTDKEEYEEKIDI